MRLASLVAAGCLATCAFGCSFFVNFSALTRESATASDAGPDGSPDCCDDGDPCTDDICVDGGPCGHEPVVCPASDDTCHVNVCVEGACKETAIEGFVDDGFSSELAGDPIFRTTTVAAGGRFYVATYGTFGGQPDIILRVYKDDVTTDTALEYRVGKDLDSELEIASPAAIAVDKLFVNVYFATRPSDAGTLVAGQMQRVRFFKPTSENLVLADRGILTSAPNFRGGDTLGPAAGLVGAEDQLVPFVVWPGCATISNSAPTNCVTANHDNHGVYVQSGFDPVNLDPDLKEAVFFRESARIAGLAALGSGPQIGAAWMVLDDNDEVSLRTEFLAEDGAPAGSVVQAQCIKPEDPQGYALASAATPDGSLRVLGWSQSFDSGEFATQLETLTCEGPLCTQSNSDCEDAHRLLVGDDDAVRNVDVTGITGEYFARATVTNPVRETTNPSETDSTLELVLWQLPSSGSADAGIPDSGIDSWSSAPKVLSSLVSSRNGSLDWPSIAASGGRVLVAWNEPRDGSTVRHLMRQRVCLPNSP